MTAVGDCSVLVPIKRFELAKARLAPSLSPDKRAALAKEMAAQVLRAARGMDLWVVCDDHEVSDWALAHGAEVSWQPGRGLNAAVSAATNERFVHGASRVAVVHGDLPLVSSLAWLADRSDALILVPDRHGTGTNVVSTPTKLFEYSYGAGSFERHKAEARRLGLVLSIVEDHALGWDIDVPDDLSALPSHLR